MEGEMFLTINPDTLNDEEIWTYRDLQLISTQLGLKANLKRCKLVANLTKWHRGRTEDDKNLVPDKQNEENLEMNVVGNNFALLAVSVNKKRKTRYSTSSRDSLLIVDYEDGQFKVSPSKVQRFSTTPGKGILKSSAPNTHDNNNSSNNNENGLRSSSKKLSNICFSPFNGVKVITHRSDMMEYGEDLWIANILNENENDDDEYSYCDEDSDEDDDETEEEEEEGDDDDKKFQKNNGIDKEKVESVYIYDYPIEYDVEL